MHRLQRGQVGHAQQGWWALVAVALGDDGDIPAVQALVDQGNGALARLMVEGRTPANQLPSACTRCGATASRVARSRRCTARGSGPWALTSAQAPRASRRLAVGNHGVKSSGADLHAVAVMGDGLLRASGLLQCLA